MDVLEKAPVAGKSETSSAKFPKVEWSWQQPALAAILLLAAFLNLYRLDQNGYTNEYYAAAVRSMLVSWHNFFFNAYDPGGFITIDKPPVAFWLQTISAWFFGYSGITILLPSVAAGVASVALLYHLVKKAFGANAGLLAALALAVTPISVIMNRHNNPESILVFCLLLAAWALTKAAEKGRIGWLLLSVGLVGVGFNIKMLEAFVVLPAFYLVYFLLTPIQWWKRILHLAIATAVLTAVSLSWALAVDMTPAGQRPYVGGSTNNSVMNLILEYNGVGRIDGEQMGPGAGGNRPGQNGQPQFRDGGNANGATGTNPRGQGQAPNNGNFQPGQGFPGGGNFQPGQGFPGGTGNGVPPSQISPGGGNFQPGQGFPGGARPGGGPGGVIAGQAGVFRMFDPQLAGETAWLLPLALLGLLFAAVQTWRRFPAGAERRQRYQSLLLWGGWLLTFMVVFSSAKGIFHSYYLVMLSPAIAALVGASLETLWHAYRQGSWRSWFLPLFLTATAVFQFSILSAYSDWNRVLGLVVVGITVVAACALLAVPRVVSPAGFNWAAGVTTVAVLALNAAPLAWATNTLLAKTYTNATLPTAVPAGANFSSVGSSGLLANLQSNWNSWLTGLVIGLVILAGLLVALRFFQAQLQARSTIERGMTLAAVAVVITLALSLAFTALPPAAAASGRGFQPAAGQIGNPAMSLNGNDKLLAYLEANRAGATYLLATGSSQNASALIIKSGEPIMAMGGFSGRDAVLTSADIAKMVQNNTVRFFLLDGLGGFGGGGRGSTQSATGWVQQNCQAVNSQLWSGGSGTTTNGRGGFGGGGTLYDCSSHVLTSTSVS